MMPVCNLLVLIRILRHWKVTSVRNGCIFYLDCYVPYSSFLRTVKETKIEIFSYLPRTRCIVKRERALAGGLEAQDWVLALYLTCYMWPWASFLTSVGLHMLHCKMDQITDSQQEQNSMGEVWLFDDWTGAKNHSHPTMYRTVLNNETVPRVPQVPRQNIL